MKTAGIVLRNFNNGLSELDFSSSDAFLKAGYPFEEVRLLSRKDREAFLKAAEELAAESENLVVIAEKSLLPSAREWLSEKFNTNFLQGFRMNMMEWVICPICNNKTRIKIRKDTQLKNFPLYCPKCKKESLICVNNFKIEIIKEPDALDAEPMNL